MGHGYAGRPAAADTGIVLRPPPPLESGDRGSDHLKAAAFQSPFLHVLTEPPITGGQAPAGCT